VSLDDFDKFWRALHTDTRAQAPRISKNVHKIDAWTRDSGSIRENKARRRGDCKRGLIRSWTGECPKLHDGMFLQSMGPFRSWKERSLLELRKTLRLSYIQWKEGLTLRERRQGCWEQLVMLESIWEVEERKCYPWEYESWRRNIIRKHLDVRNGHFFLYRILSTHLTRHKTQNLHHPARVDGVVGYRICLTPDLGCSQKVLSSNLGRLMLFGHHLFRSTLFFLIYHVSIRAPDNWFCLFFWFLYGSQHF